MPRNGNYNLTSANAACVSCHLKDFQGATQPNHVQSNFSQTCTQCHNTTHLDGCEVRSRNHRLPVDGRAATVQCTQCHVNGNYSLTRQCGLRELPPEGLPGGHTIRTTCSRTSRRLYAVP